MNYVPVNFPQVRTSYRRDQKQQAEFLEPKALSSNIKEKQGDGTVISSNKASRRMWKEMAKIFIVQYNGNWQCCCISAVMGSKKQTICSNLYPLSNALPTKYPPEDKGFDIVQG